jgi:molybdopterin-guanine dinucleotide biosynthesis protein A
MGRPKPELPFGNESMLERILRLVAPHVDDIIIAAGPGQHLPAGWNVVRDAAEGMGPVPALLAAMPRAAHEVAFVIACDTPLLQPALIGALVERCAGWDACVPVVDGLEMTTCAVYRPAAVLAAAAAAGPAPPRSLRKLLTPLRVRRVHEDELRPLDPGLLTFTSCNTPDEYQHALVLAGLAPSALD